MRHCWQNEWKQQHVGYVLFDNEECDPNKRDYEDWALHIRMQLVNQIHQLLFWNE